jgi:glycosyltransferase involved in cell wall biosynthesis
MRMPDGERTAPISVIVPVRNEAGNITRCLQHLRFADEVFVVDSQSTDGTAEAAEQLGARVVQFRFNGTYPKKKNWALENLPLRNEWVLIVDADEAIPPELQQEITAAVDRGDHDGYYLHFRYMFLGRELKHCGYSSLRVLRLFRHRMGRYEKMPVSPRSRTGDVEAHEHVILEGRTADLQNSVLHYAYPTIDSWVEKHNRYSNWEADLYDSFRGSDFREGEAHLPWRRRSKRRLKALYLRLPFRYVFRFLYAYVLRLGFLDGRAGFIFCGLLAFYDFLSWAKVQEKRLRISSGDVT